MRGGKLPLNLSELWVKILHSAATSGGTRRDLEKLREAINVLFFQERAEILVAAFQCAYAMAPLLDTDVAVEAAVTAPSAGWY